VERPLPRVQIAAPRTSTAAKPRIMPAPLPAMFSAGGLRTPAQVPKPPLLPLALLCGTSTAPQQSVRAGPAAYIYAIMDVARRTRLFVVQCVRVLTGRLLSAIPTTD
jgi:hypothetical protein